MAKRCGCCTSNRRNLSMSNLERLEKLLKILEMRPINKNKGLKARIVSVKAQISELTQIE